MDAIQQEGLTAKKAESPCVEAAQTATENDVAQHNASATPPVNLTNGKNSARWHLRLLTALSWMVYFASYITRINYGAIIVEFIAAEGVLKTAASVITLALFVTYGAGQLLSGYLGDRFSPRKLIFMGLAVAVICNFLMPLCTPRIPVMAAIWGINGLAQAFIWPPLVKILTSALSREDYARMVPGISTSAACATITVYLVSPLIISLSGWKSVFYIFGTAAMAAALVWLVCSRKLLKDVDFSRIPDEKKDDAASASPGVPEKTLWRLLPVILLAVAAQGMLRDGITTWVPTFISETFQMESTVSILTGVALPVFHVLVSLCTYRILHAMKNDVFGCIAVFFFAAALLLLGLSLFGMQSMVLSLVLIAVANGTIQGVNILQTCYLPACFQHSGNVSFLAGLINSATYAGSALSTYLFAAISERRGWGATVISWVVFSACGAALTLICMAVLKAKKQSVPR